jgi:hypothetical protein
MLPHSYAPNVLDPEQSAAFLAFPDRRAVFSHCTSKDELVKILSNPRPMRDSVSVDFPFLKKFSSRAIFGHFTTAPKECVDVPVNVNDEPVGLSNQVSSVHEDPLVGNLALSWLKVICPDDLEQACQYLGL